MREVFVNNMITKPVRIDNDTEELLDKCVLEFLKNHPEMKKIPISKNKIIFEVAGFYLRS